MDVRVNQPRHDQQAVGIDYLARLSDRDLGSNRRDHAAGEGDIAPVVDSLCRVDERTARNDEIVGCHLASPLRHSICLRR